MNSILGQIFFCSKVIFKKGKFVHNYRELFKNNHLKLLKGFFTELLNNTQPCIIQVKIGTGWDWLEASEDISLLISKEEIIQCSIDGNSFVVYVDFGKGYRWLTIPFECIKTIFIGEIISVNYIKSPVEPEKFNLDEKLYEYLTEGESNDTVE